MHSIKITLLFLLLIIFPLVSYSQNYDSPGNYGLQYKRLKADSAFKVPVLTDTFRLTNKSGDGDIIYVQSPTGSPDTGFWTIVKGKYVKGFGEGETTIPNLQQVVAVGNVADTAIKAPGFIIRDTTGNYPWILTNREANLDLTVAAILPTEGVANKAFALDIVPRGNPLDYYDNGKAWIDIGDRDNSRTNIGGRNLRLGIRSDAIQIGLKNYTSDPNIPIEFISNSSVRARIDTAGHWRFFKNVTIDGTTELFGPLLTSNVVGTKTGVGKLTLFSNGVAAADFTTLGKTALGGIVDATAILELKGGDGGANSAPLKIRGGARMVTPEAGAIEYDSTSLYFTNNSLARGRIEINTSLVTSLDTTLSPTYTHYSFTGTTATWKLPPISGNKDVEIRIKNRGSGNITLNTNAGGNDIYDSSAVNTTTIGPGEAWIFYNDGTYWLLE